MQTFAKAACPVIKTFSIEGKKGDPEFKIGVFKDALYLGNIDYTRQFKIDVTVDRCSVIYNSQDIKTFDWNIDSKVTIVVTGDVTKSENKFIENSNSILVFGGSLGIDKQEFNKLLFKTEATISFGIYSTSPDMKDRYKLVNVMRSYFQKYYTSHYSTHELKVDFPFANLFEYGTAKIKENPYETSFEIQIEAPKPLTISE